MSRFICSGGGCNREVRGIYCPQHREEKAKARNAAREAASARLKTAWEEHRAERLEALARARQASAAKRAPATEGR